MNDREVVLLWRVEFDRKVGALSLREQLALRGRVGWRKDWPDDGNGASTGKKMKEKIQSESDILISVNTKNG